MGAYRRGLSPQGVLVAVRKGVWKNRFHTLSREELQDELGCRGYEMGRKG